MRLLSPLPGVGGLPGDTAPAVWPVAPGLLLTAVTVVLAVAVGIWIYVDARRRGREEVAHLLGAAVGGLFLAGTLPGVVALAVAEDAAVQGFPTAIRIIPGVVALGVYLYAR